jgi:hypothetical protein
MKRWNKVLAAVVGSLLSTMAMADSFKPALTPMSAASAAATASTTPVPVGKASADDIINATRAGETVTKYDKGETNPNKDLFASGKGVLTTPGGARVTACTSKTDPECIAVQLMQHNATSVPLVTINKDDPLLANAKAIKSGAMLPTADGGMGINPDDIAKTVSACTTNTAAADAVYETKVCDIYTELPASSTCKATRVVNVDKQYNYQCDSSLLKEVTYQCQKKLDVIVTKAANCTPGTPITQTGVTGWCYKASGSDGWYGPIRVAPLCDLIDDQNNVRIGMYVANPIVDEGSYGYPGCGGGGNWVNLSLPLIRDFPKTVSTSTSLVTIQAKDKSWFGTTYLYMLAGSGCDTNDNCSYTFRRFTGKSCVGSGPDGFPDFTTWGPQICNKGGCSQCAPDLRNDDTLTVKFKAAKIVAQATDSWINDCAGLEARQ